MVDQRIHFDVGDVSKTHNITIYDDSECENDPFENFLSSIALEIGISPLVNITQPLAQVTIFDSGQDECGERGSITCF